MLKVISKLIIKHNNTIIKLVTINAKVVIIYQKA